MAYWLGIALTGSAVKQTMFLAIVLLVVLMIWSICWNFVSDYECASSEIHCAVPYDHDFMTGMWVTWSFIMASTRPHHLQFVIRTVSWEREHS